MAGTILNIVAIIIGSSLGLIVGKRLTASMQSSIVMGVGLVTIVLGVQNVNLSGNIVIPLLSIVIGVIIGETLQLHSRLESLGSWLQQRFTESADSDSADDNAVSSRERFITGFVTATLVFCIGPLTFVGAIQDGMGLEAGLQFLMIKSVLDFFTSMAFASTFGIGVMFTVLSVLVIQGGLALVGSLFIQVMADPNFVNSLSNNPMINELTAVGGVLLMALALELMDIKHPRVANFLPALILAPLIVGVAHILGINIYPL